MVASGTYPNRDKPGGYDAYTDCLAHFIRDVRKGLNAPKMKFVIGVMGVGGPLDKYASPRYLPIHGNFRNAMAAPSEMPEFKGNVSTVYTHPLSQGGASNSHYNGNAQTYMDVGLAMGEAMVRLLEEIDE